MVLGVQNTMYQSSDYDGETYARIARRAARAAERREDEAREEHAAFLAREEAECVFLDAMTNEEQNAYLAFDEATREAVFAASVSMPFAAAQSWMQAVGSAFAMKQAA